MPSRSTSSNAPEYYGIVRDLAARAGLPMPKTYLIQNPQPNAFATGRNPAERRRGGDDRPARAPLLRGGRRRDGA